MYDLYDRFRLISGSSSSAWWSVSKLIGLPYKNIVESVLIPKLRLVVQAR